MNRIASSGPEGRARPPIGRLSGAHPVMAGVGPSDVVIARDYTPRMTGSNDGLPRFARIRIEQAMPRGHVEIIQVRPQRFAPPIAVEAWDLRSDADHGRSSERAVTLFQHEHLSVLENLLGRPVEFSQPSARLSVGPEVGWSLGRA